MTRSPSTVHNLTNYASGDGQNSIYRINIGNQDYIAENTVWYGDYVIESDINFNMYYSFANSAQPNAFDVWSIFLHETGHTAGLDDLYSSSYSTSVMYKWSNTNTTKRYLVQDDIDGINEIY